MNELKTRTVIAFLSLEEMEQWIQRQKEIFGDKCPTYIAVKVTTTKEEIV